jgi:penicillin-binding protein 1A
VNAEHDELLFNQEKGASSTVVYANSSYSNDEYIPVRLDIGGQTKKIYYNLDEISNYLIDGFISVEDRSFYQHSGVDMRRTVYATVNYLSGKGKFGASTITQQLIKNISGDNEVSIQRKVTEIIRAYNVEKKHSKNEIMEVYLNVIPMGNEIYGVGAASEIYFGKSPIDLNAAEAATLIGITNAPSAYDPYKNPEKCLEKRNRILQVMFSQGIIDNDELLLSLDSPLNISGRSYENADSWYVETVISDVVRDYAEKMNVSDSMARLVILSGVFSIYTPIILYIYSISSYPPIFKYYCYTCYTCYSRRKKAL